MRADPEPDQRIAFFNRQRAIAKPHTYRPEAADFLKVQGRMLRIVLQQRVTLVGQSANVVGKLGVGLPERRAGEMPHSSRARPWRKSARAASARRSSLPALASRSIFSSKRAESNSSNQARNFASWSGGSLETAFSRSSMVMAIEYHELGCAEPSRRHCRA